MADARTSAGPSAAEADSKDPITAMSSARSRSGNVSVVTTAQGLPMSVRIENAALAKEPSTLANEVLRLCQQSAMAAGIRIREHLLETGVSREIVDEMKLPKPDDLARAEQRDDHADDAPATWLRPV